MLHSHDASMASDMPVTPVFSIESNDDGDTIMAMVELPKDWESKLLPVTDDDGKVKALPVARSSGSFAGIPLNVTVGSGRFKGCPLTANFYIGIPASAVKRVLAVESRSQQR